jgi:hypothetical protein
VVVTTWARFGFIEAKTAKGIRQFLYTFRKAFLGGGKEDITRRPSG